MNHLTPGELVDAIDGTLSAARHVHLRDCAACAREAAELEAVLRKAQEIAVPEPSPLFWDHLSARVQAATAGTAPRHAGWRRHWMPWPVLASAGLAVLLAIMLATLAGRSPVATNDIAAGIDAAAEPATGDLAGLGEQEWVLVSQIVGAVDPDTAVEAGIVVRPGDVERAALELTEAEQRELIRLVRAEIAKAGG